MDKLASKFQFKDYKINHIRYTLNENFDNSEPMQLDINLNTIIGISEDSNDGKVTLDVTIFEDAKEKNFPFSLEISLTGYFTADSEMSKEDFSKFLQLNGTAALFPFLRSSIADITRTANVETLVLPLINIYNLNSQS